MKKKFSKPELSRIINGDIVLPSPLSPVPRERLDLKLLKDYPNETRATLQRLIRRGCVSVNGTIVRKPSTPILDADIVELAFPPALPVLPPLPILYSDDEVLVVDKPAGLLSMSKGTYDGEVTLEDYGFLVHRLDRETSGVVILAKNEEVRAFLQRQFQARTVEKEYYAITEGYLKHLAAMINLPLKRNLKRPTTFQVDASGREAITNYTVVDQTERHSLVCLRPLTGRTHQLRVHLAYLHAPILGDTVYQKKNSTSTSGLYLHAAKLTINLPTRRPDGSLKTKTRQTFISNLPPKFSKLFPSAAKYPITTTPANDCLSLHLDDPAAPLANSNQAQN